MAKEILCGFGVNVDAVAGWAEEIAQLTSTRASIGCGSASG